VTYTSSKLISLAALSLFITGCQLSSKHRQMREWQALNDTIRECSQKIQNIVNVIHQSPYTTEETQKSLLHEIDSIDQRMKQAIRNCAERNKDNDLGKYILDNYSEE
jgi:cell division protein ZapA (FtsZ GTPase activity inhibitor)